MPVSILILTRNEDMNLPGLLDSLQGGNEGGDGGGDGGAEQWADDIVLFDSKSTDRTQDIARERGCRVVERAFDNWASHQNWAMENIDFKYRWVFYLDADERMTPELWAEITQIAKAWDSGERSDEKGDPPAYYCGRRNFFRGKWIKHAMPPGLIMRFFQPPKIRFERLVNPVPVVDGPTGYLSNLFDHHNFSKGIAEWFEKHNRYSSAEAQETIRSQDGRRFRIGELLSRDRGTRRQALKALSERTPARPLLKFLYLYIAGRGFLDGRPGLTYCVLQAIYEYQIVLKVIEERRRAKGLTPS